MHLKHVKLSQDLVNAFCSEHATGCLTQDMAGNWERPRSASSLAKRTKTGFTAQPDAPPALDNTHWSADNATLPAVK